MRRPELLFVSTRFLFPVDSGGKIRTTQVLRGMKDGRFRVTLVSPGTAELASRYARELDSVCDRFVWWPAPSRSRLFHYTRLRFLASSLPIPVRTDRDKGGIALIEHLLENERFDVVVFDFAHAAVLAPPHLSRASVLFTHNVETEIFERHLKVARDPLSKLLWRNQSRKMREFERRALNAFDLVVAVAERDAAQFVEEYGVHAPIVIPTGVDVDYFAYAPPVRDHDVVFCGSMDWLPNQEAVSWFMDEVWGRIVARHPDAKMTVVGRAPPRRLVDAAARRGLRWSFTGFVDDVRPYVQGAAVSVIPLRVGGGTRLKVYESMAMGTPVVSTGIGVEGLPIKPDEHFFEANDADAMAEAVVKLLVDRDRRLLVAAAARKLVEQRFSYQVAAEAFQEACSMAIQRHEESLGHARKVGCQSGAVLQTQ